MRMVLFAISSKLIFNHFIYHTLLFIIPYSFPSYFTSITLITTHPCYSFLLSSMFFMHSFPSLSSSQPLQSISLLSISTPILSFHSIASLPFICYSFFDSTFSHVQLCLPPFIIKPSFCFHSFLRFSSFPIILHFYSMLLISFISFLLFSS